MAKHGEHCWFRSVVMKLGGVKIPSDYEYLPRWCKRKKGLAIDEMVDELKPYGLIFEDANALYEFIINH